MSPCPPFPLKVGVVSPSSYGDMVPMVAIN